VPPALFSRLGTIGFSPIQTFEGFTVWTCFQSDEVVIQAINEWIEEQEQRFFVGGVQALKYRWEKCVTLRVDYAEKL
jgi:hypothetical protein